MTEFSHFFLIYRFFSNFQHLKDFEQKMFRHKTSSQFITFMLKLKSL